MVILMKSSRNSLKRNLPLRFQNARRGPTTHQKLRLGVRTRALLIRVRTKVLLVLTGKRNLLLGGRLLAQLAVDVFPQNGGRRRRLRQLVQKLGTLRENGTLAEQQLLAAVGGERAGLGEERRGRGAASHQLLALFVLLRGDVTLEFGVVAGVQEAGLFAQVDVVDGAALDHVEHVLVGQP
uniref:(northern house mosquito) hypothetical protein n=1 Tax=Culex pipiens TaxID=7175 RepID=A0A8D8D064_CULPI